MPIVLFLGAGVNEYKKISQEAIAKAIAEGKIRCDHCNRPLSRHSKYQRGIKETQERIEIVVARCKNCGTGHALLPDFILPRKHYSAYEVENVVASHSAQPVSEIETAASEFSVRRWIKIAGEWLQGAISSIKWLSLQMGAAVSEIRCEAKTQYEELVRLLDSAPRQPKSSYSYLGLANLWLGMRGCGWYF